MCGCEYLPLPARKQSERAPLPPSCSYVTENKPRTENQRFCTQQRPSPLPLPFSQTWSGPERLLALDELIDRCETGQVKHMMQVIEPQFQRDFISLLPKEVRVCVRQSRARVSGSAAAAR